MSTVEDKVSLTDKRDSIKKNRSRRGGRGRQSTSKPLAEQNINLPKEGLNYNTN